MISMQDVQVVKLAAKLGRAGGKREDVITCLCADTKLAVASPSNDII